MWFIPPQFKHQSWECGLCPWKTCQNFSPNIKQLILTLFPAVSLFRSLKKRDKAEIQHFTILQQLEEQSPGGFHQAAGEYTFLLWTMIVSWSLTSLQACTTGVLLILFTSFSQPKQENLSEMLHFCLWWIQLTKNKNNTKIHYNLYQVDRWEILYVWKAIN